MTPSAPAPGEPVGVQPRAPRAIVAQPGGPPREASTTGRAKTGGNARDPYVPTSANAKLCATPVYTTPSTSTRG